MGITKDEYLRKKGYLPPKDFGSMFYFKSNKRGVSEIQEFLIWNKTSSNGKVVYELKDCYFGVKMKENENFKKSGDWFEDEYDFYSLDRNLLEKLRKKEKKRRIIKKYFSWLCK